MWLALLVLALGMAVGPTDDELVRRFKGGDRQSFSDLVLRYQDRIFSLCVRNLGDRQVAEEVSQDVFVAAFRALANFRGESSFSTWIFRIAVNHCKNRRLYRRRRAHGRHEPIEGLPRDDAPARELPHPGPGTERGAEQSEAGKMLQDALESLDDTHRDIIVLRDIDGLAYEEISDILDVARGTVKSRLHRARAQLARALTRKIGVADVLD